MINRKEYVAVASMLCTEWAMSRDRADLARWTPEMVTVHSIAAGLAELFSESNVRFDREKFERAVYRDDYEMVQSLNDEGDIEKVRNAIDGLHS